jgi:hypothetical protein
VPKPRDKPDRCNAARDDKPVLAASKPKANADEPKARRERGTFTSPPSSPKADGAGSAGSAPPATPANDVTMSASVLHAPRPGDVIQLAPNIISVKHWDRLLGGLLYAVQPRVDWATLLRDAA